MVNPQDLKEREKGYVPHHEEWNALVRAARRKQIRGEGFVDSVADVSIATERARILPIQGYASQEIPPYSVFGVFGIPSEVSNEGATRVAIEKIGITDNGGSIAGLYTNGGVTCRVGWNHVFPIGIYTPVIVRVEDTDADITIGQFCGPKLGTWGVTRKRQGLVCVADNVNIAGTGGVPGGTSMYSAGYIGESSSGQLIKVVRSVEPISIIVESVTDVTEFAAGVLGTGQAKIKWRNDSGALVDAPDPATGEPPWVVDIFNPLVVGILTGTTLTVTSMLGVGLVILDRVDTGDSLQLVKLTAALTAGGSAAAVLMEWDGDSWEPTATAITVHDPTGRISAADDDKLWTVPKAASGRYEAVSPGGGAAATTIGGGLYQGGALTTTSAREDIANYPFSSANGITVDETTGEITIETDGVYRIGATANVAYNGTFAGLTETVTTSISLEIWRDTGAGYSQFGQSLCDTRCAIADGVSTIQTMAWTQDRDLFAGDKIKLRLLPGHPQDNSDYHNDLNDACFSVMRLWDIPP